MKFPRSAKILRSHFDVAPFAAVFFLAALFIMLGALMPVPGIPLQPPSADDLPGTDQPTVAMAVDSLGRIYFANAEVKDEFALKSDLAAAVKASAAPLTLVIHADKLVPYEQLAHLALLARGPQIGITNIILATLPRTPDFTGKP
jgi:biopolymer transport protein ExbD